MKHPLIWLAILITAVPLGGRAQETDSAAFQMKASLAPIEFGFRYDDNVYRSTDSSDRLSDEIFLLNAGAQIGSTYDIYKGSIGYHLGADQYEFYSALDNIKNYFDILVEAEPGNFIFYYRKSYFIRSSQYGQFNYIDDDNILGAQWIPSEPWDFEVKFKDFSRTYYDNDPEIQAQNFEDQGILAGIQREIDPKFSLKLEGSYNNRQFNRWAVTSINPIVGTIQTDETWSALLNAHLYFGEILQDFNFEEQRTLSNSYGFSNTVQSVSWDAVVRPSPTIYLQLLFRLFSKNYDAQPLVNPDLHIGFIDEDSQDLLSIKASWEFSPQWSAGLNLSRFRNEYIQPGQFYIENLSTVNLQRKF